jgi:putative membrane protein
MKNVLVVVSALALTAGCTHRDYQQNASGSYTSETAGYYNNSSPEAATANTKGAGARALTGQNPNSDLSSQTITTETVSPSGINVASSEASTANTQGAAARAQIGENPNSDLKTQEGTLTTGIASSDASTANTKGAGARALTGGNPNSDLQPNGGVVLSATGREAAPDSPKGVGAAATLGTETSTTTTTTSDKPANADATFVKEAAQSGLAEIRMGKLAEQNGQDQGVKDFGKKLVADHTKANEELTQLASQKGFEVPTTISTKDNMMLEKLSALQGVDFDRACAQHAVEAHTKAVKKFKTAASTAQDADVKAFAQKTLPTLEEHLTAAKQLSTGNPTVTPTGRTAEEIKQ